MKAKIEVLIHQALMSLANQDQLTVVLTDFVVEHPRDKSHGDFSSNVAMVNCKVFACSPRILAEKICQHFPADPAIAKLEIAGPGFINFYLNQAYLRDALERIFKHPRCGVQHPEQPLTVVVDYSSPNLAKEMHVGHLRSTIIGDAIAKVLEFKGHQVIRQNHVGDWGTQFGMLLAHFIDEEQASSGHLALTDLEIFYKAAKSRFDADPSFAERARQWVVLLQSGDERCLKLWHKFIRLSLDHAQDIYHRLGVSLTEADVRPESFYNPELPHIVKLLQEQGLLVKHEGAQCVFLPQFKGKNEEPLPIIVQKNDGGFLYASTDLAAMRYRQQNLHADRVLYVVDARQSLHFEQVFALAKLAGFVNKTMQLEHIRFGMVLDKSGRPFKSRDGGVTKLAELLDEAVRRAKTLIQVKSNQDAMLDEMAEVIGIASVKYADLSKNRNSDYVFDWDSMISFEGNTAPYLLYAYTRIMSIFAKAKLEPAEITDEFRFSQVQEEDLAKQLSQFPELIDAVVEKSSPHLLCSYLYELAGLFSSFYEHCPILGHELAMSRLKLAALTAKVLKQGLSLLGISTLDRM